MAKVKDMIKKIETNDEYRREFFADPGGMLEREFPGDITINDALKAELKREVVSQKRKLSRTVRPVTAAGVGRGRAGRRSRKTRERVSIVM